MSIFLKSTSYNISGFICLLNGYEVLSRVNVYILEDYGIKCKGYSFLDLM